MSPKGAARDPVLLSKADCLLSDVAPSKTEYFAAPTADEHRQTDRGDSDGPPAVSKTSYVRVRRRRGRLCRTLSRTPRPAFGRRTEITPVRTGLGRCEACRLPALLAPVRTLDGCLEAVQWLFIREDGSPAEFGERKRHTGSPRQGAVRFGDPCAARRVAICEDVQTPAAGAVRARAALRASLCSARTVEETVGNIRRRDSVGA